MRALDAAFAARRTVASPKHTARSTLSRDRASSRAVAKT